MLFQTHFLMRKGTLRILNCVWCTEILQINGTFESNHLKVLWSSLNSSKYEECNQGHKLVGWKYVSNYIYLYNTISFNKHEMQMQWIQSYTVPIIAITKIDLELQLNCSPLCVHFIFLPKIQTIFINIILLVACFHIHFPLQARFPTRPEHWQLLIYSLFSASLNICIKNAI